MAQTFPWPATEVELVLANALDDVMAAYGHVGETEEAWVREASARLKTMKQFGRWMTLACSILFLFFGRSVEAFAAANCEDISAGYWDNNQSMAAEMAKARWQQWASPGGNTTGFCLSTKEEHQWQHRS